MSQDYSPDELDSYTLDENWIDHDKQQKCINNVSSSKAEHRERHIDKIYAWFKLNDNHRIWPKIDTGADTCTMTDQDFKKSKLGVKIEPNDCILYTVMVAAKLQTTAAAKLKISYKDKSTVADFKIVKSAWQLLNSRMQKSARAMYASTQRQ